MSYTPATQERSCTRGSCRCDSGVPRPSYKNGLKSSQVRECGQPTSAARSARCAPATVSLTRGQGWCHALPPLPAGMPGGAAPPCPLTNRRVVNPPHDNRLCTSIQHARTWPGNTNATAAVLVIVTHDRTVLQLRQSIKSWDAHLLSEDTWLLLQVDPSAAGFTAAEAAIAIGLLGRGHCQPPKALRSRGYEAWRTPKGRGVLAWDAALASWPPFGQGALGARNKDKERGEYMLATKAYVRAMRDVTGLEFFDFWIKVDTDIVFHSAAPLLARMASSGAHFAHTGITEEAPAHYVATLIDCIGAYVRDVGCSKSHGRRPAVAQPSETLAYFSNVVGGWLGLWQSEQMLKFAEHWWQWPGGWRAPARWTDQEFWSQALWLAGAYTPASDYMAGPTVLDLTEWRGECEHSLALQYVRRSRAAGKCNRTAAPSRFSHKPAKMVGTRSGSHGPMPGGFTAIGADKCSPKAQSCVLLRSARARERNAASFPDVRRFVDPLLGRYAPTAQPAQAAPVVNSTLSPRLARLIRAHVEQLQRELAALRCRGCADWFTRTYWRSWHSSVVRAEAARLQKHAALFEEFMPSSERRLSPDRKGWMANAEVIQGFSPFDYFEAEFSCPAEARLPGDMVGDGSKWVCGVALHRPPCQVLSLGSDHDDRFERSAHAAAACASYIVDPTLSAFNDRTRSAERLQAFQRQVESYGSSLNVSVAAGQAPGGALNFHGEAYPRVSLETLLHDHGGFRAKQGGGYHVSVLKADIEKSEYGALEELWTLCEAGRLTVSQLNVEVHLAELPPSVTFRSLHRLFAGARACGLMLHHKEINTWSRQPCAEFAWVAGAHAQRAVASLVRSIARDRRRQREMGAQQQQAPRTSFDKLPERRYLGFLKYTHIIRLGPASTNTVRPGEMSDDDATESPAAPELTTEETVREPPVAPQPGEAGADTGSTSSSSSSGSSNGSSGGSSSGTLASASLATLQSVDLAAIILTERAKGTRGWC